MKRRWKILLLVLLAVGVLVYLVMPHGGPRRSVEALKEQLRAKGEKLTMAELAPPVSSNGVEAAKAFTNAIAGFRLGSNYPSSLTIIVPGIAVLGHSNLEPAQMSDYSSNLVRSSELRATLGASKLDFNLDYSMGSQLPLIHYVTVRSGAQLFAITLVQSLHETNRGEAWLNLEALVKLVHCYQGETLLISDLVRNAVGMIAITATWDALQEDCWTTNQLVILQTLWENVNFTNQLESTIRTERVFGIDAMEKARSEGFAKHQQILQLYSSFATTTLTNEDVFDLREKFEELKSRYKFWIWKSSSSYKTEIFNIEMANAALNSARSVNNSKAFFSAIRDYDQQETNLTQIYPESKSTSDIYRISDGFYRTYLERAADAEAARRLLVKAIALKRYRLQHNSYPASLSELVPAFLGAVLRDPWDGKELRYRLQPDARFLLYSVGRNGEDDGGNATRQDGAISSSWFLGKDIVWPRLATPSEVEKYRESRSRTNSNAEK